MDLRLAPVAALLFGAAALAQPPVTQTPVPPPVPAPTPETKQDPDKPKPTPADQARELAAEKDRLQREIEYARDRAKNVKVMLNDKLGAKPAAWKAIDAGVSAPPVPTSIPSAAPREARVATPEELANHGNDTLLIVNGRAIPKSAFDEVMAHVAKSAAAGDEKARAQRVLFDLVRTEAIASAFEDNEVAERTGDLMGQLEAGKSAAELAKAVGVVLGADAEGKVTVTRNCGFGPRFEQVAFATEPGKRSRPFRNANGIVLLAVTAFEKGETPEQDRVTATAIQVPYTPDVQALQKAQMAVNTGQIDVLARDQQTLEMLPPLLRRSAAMQQKPIPVDVTAVTKQLEQLNADIQALQGKTDEDSQAKLRTLQRAYEQLKMQLRGAGDGTDAVKPLEVKVPGTDPGKTDPIKKD
jgi:hypothetical protein